MRSRPAFDRRPVAHAIVSVATILLLVASVRSLATLDRVLWSIPHILANVSQLVLLTLATFRKPREINESAAAFALGLVGTLSPFFVAWSAAAFPAGAPNDALVVVGRYANLAVMPFYLVAIWTLGTNLTVLPEASTLQTTGVYSVSRHPLYATYLYWYLVQIAIFQSWVVVLLSAIQVAVTIARARLEEEILARHFPEYALYKQRVGWWGRSAWLPWARRRAEPTPLA